MDEEHDEEHDEEETKIEGKKEDQSMRGSKMNTKNKRRKESRRMSKSKVLRSRVTARSHVERAILRFLVQVRTLAYESICIQVFI